MRAKIINVGPHRLAAGMLGGDDALPAIMQDNKAGVVYVDPPWGPGNTKFWRTHNKGRSPEQKWAALLNSLADAACQYCAGAIFIEMGCRWIADLDAAMKETGSIAWSAVIPTTYKMGGVVRPNRLWCGTVNGTKVDVSPLHDPLGAGRPPHSINDDHLRDHPGVDIALLRDYPGGRAQPEVALQVADKYLQDRHPIVLDPCCGLGNTARAAVAAGLRFRGMEMNPDRLERSVKLLERLTGLSRSMEGE